MPEAIYSSYSKAKEVLEKINALVPPIDSTKAGEAKKAIEEFFTADPFFAQFCTNIYGKTFEPDSLELFNNPAEITPEALENFRKPILLFVLNAASENALASTTIEKQKLDELVEEFTKSQAIKNSKSLEQVKQKIPKLPTVGEWIRSLKVNQQTKIIQAQQAHQQIVRNLQAQILKAQDKKVIQGIRELNPSQTPTDAVENVSAAAEQVAREITHEIGEHLQSGGDIKDPLLKTALKTEVERDVPAAVLFKKEEVKKAIDDAVELASQNPQEFLAAHQASKLNTPTPTEIVKNIKSVIQDSGRQITDQQAIELFVDIEKTLISKKDITVRQAAINSLSEKFPELSQENLLKITNNIFPSLQNYTLKAAKVFSLENLKEEALNKTSNFCIAFNQEYYQTLNKVLGLRGALEFASGLTDVHAQKIAENQQFSGQPISKSLAHKLEILKQITPERIQKIADKGLSLPSLKKLPIPSFLQKPISVAQDFGGAIGKIPGLKRVGGFLQGLSPSRLIKTKIASWLLSFGAKQAAKKGLMGLLGKGATWLGGKLAGKGIGALIGGALGSAAPIVGTVIGAVAGAAIGKLLNKENLKKALKIAGGILAFGIGLLGGLISALGSFALSAAGVGMFVGGIFFPPLAPILMPAGLFLTASGLWKSAKPLLAKAGNAAQAFIQNLASNFSHFGGASVPHYISLSPVIAVGSVASITVISYMTLISAFAIPSSGAEIGAPMGKVELLKNYSCDHPACKIADIVQKYAGGQLSQNTWHLVEEHLKSALSPAAFEELRHSVFGIAGNSNLQCVGFKLAAEKELGISLPRQNAVDFLTNHGCTIVWQKGKAMSYELLKENFSERYGLDAVWGRQPGCEAGQTCSENILCCGHIGVITKIEKSPIPGGVPRIYVTAAFGESGAIGTSQEAATAPDKILRCD